MFNCTEVGDRYRKEATCYTKVYRWKLYPNSIGLPDRAGALQRVQPEEVFATHCQESP